MDQRTLVHPQFKKFLFYTQIPEHGKRLYVYNCRTSL